MLDIKDKQSSGFIGSRWVALLPLVVMVVPAVFLSMQGILATNVLIAGGVIGLMLGSLLARCQKNYWQVVIDALCDPTGLLVFSLFLIVGIYSELLTAAKLGEGLVWLANHMDVGPGLFVLFVYVLSAILGTAMGTSLGTIIIMTPVLFPAAVLVGVPPPLAAGAILSGAATGDHLAPVSDTTIISSATQRFKYKDACADIGEVVRARLLYTLPAFFLSAALYWGLGSIQELPAMDASLTMNGSSSPAGLVMLLPMLAVVVAAIMGSNVFSALTLGTLAGFVISLSMGLITPHDIFYVEGQAVHGLLVEGATKNLDTIVMIVLMMGCYGVIRAYGLLETIVESLKGVAGRTVRATELTMFGIAWFLNFVLVGLVARIVVIGGPIFDELGKTKDLHPNRRANILDGVANSFSFVVPWHVWPLVMIMTITPLREIYPFIEMPKASDFIVSTFYPLLIWLVMLLSILTGYGRTFEKPENESES